MQFYKSLAFLASASAVFAQTAVPTNATLPPGLSTNAELILSYHDQNMASGASYKVDFALDASTGQKANMSVLLEVWINTNMTRVIPSNIDKLSNDSIAYISCDPEIYSQGNLNLTSTIQAATRKITPPDQSFGAIVLYSFYSAWCNYSATGSYNYTNVFVLPGQSSARLLETSLLAANAPQLAQISSPNISQNGTPIDTGDNSNNNNNSGPSAPPSTTVAMIILYSVTGIITLSFVLVIVSGALRARRHPERYGLLNLPGNAHQRRARGIARAMLETIPIVKFGEKEPMKFPRDVEQGTEMESQSRAESSLHDEEKGTSSDNVTQSSSGRASSSAIHPENPDAQAETLEMDDADNGLACSVCTEDFVKGQDLRVLPCNHKFHPECIDPWLLNVSGTCPLCRIDLRPPEAREDHVADQLEGYLNAESPQQPSQPDPATAQGSRFSIFLNRRRMVESTPAQRLRALRALRAHVRNTSSGVPEVPPINSTDSSSGSAEGNVTRSNRVSRFFGRGDEHASPTVASNSSSTPQRPE